jgi:glycosyltransferase involved in cell wall biosynthesis
LNKKIKILAISDDIRIKSGVGIQCRKILTGLIKTGKYDIVELGGSLNIQSDKPEIIDGVKVYSTNGESYGNQQQVRFLMQTERPDIVLAFSDPRFFIYLFEMDDEIRSVSKLIFYHTWDNDPFPKYNLPFYAACDGIVMISEFSYNLMKSNNVDCIQIPHMQDTKEFYPLPQEEIDKERQNLMRLTGLKQLDFVIFYNNRNLDRKRPGDVISIFEKFNKKHPNTILLMNTSLIDVEGTDLLQVQKEFLDRDIPIVFNHNKVDASKLNLFYNISDVTINIAYQEGLGLCVMESLLAGTPVVASRTGGMPEQMSYIKHYEAVVPSKDGKCCSEHDEEIVFGELIYPAVRNLFGVPGQAYIYKDFVSNDDVLSSLERLFSWKEYKHENILQNMGLAGREYIIKKYNEEDIIKKWDEYLTDIYDSPSKFKKVKTFKI